MVVAASRREARERALELLYEAESKSVHPAEVVASLPLSPDEYAVELAYGVADHQIELDHLLTRYATERWPVRRMAVMDRAVLRLGAFELATQLDVPTGAALSEAVDLGGTYGSTDDTSKFVNGILSNIAKELRDDATGWTPIECVVFDMDGVIRHWKGEAFADLERTHGLPTGTLSRVGFTQPLFGDAMTGVISAEEWFDEIGARVEEEYGVTAADVAQAWLSADWDVDEEVVGIVRDLRSAGARTALFSNASTRLETDMATMGVADDFDVVANSSVIAVAKPDTKAFEHVAGMIGTDPQRLLFVDDTVENVHGACDAGWHAVEHRGADRLRAVLARLHVLPPS